MASDASEPYGAFGLAEVGEDLKFEEWSWAERTKFRSGVSAEPTKKAGEETDDSQTVVITIRKSSPNRPPKKPQSHPVLLMWTGAPQKGSSGLAVFLRHLRKLLSASGESQISAH